MKQLIFPMAEQYKEYLIDEAKYEGYAESISFPENEEEIQIILGQLRQKNVPVTIQGGKTSITGAAIPKGGHILNVSHMNHVCNSYITEDGTGRMTVEAGINLMDLTKEIEARFRKTPMFWSVHPTETSATVGGILASGAQGITHLHYGAASQYISVLHFIDADGQIWELQQDNQILAPDGNMVSEIEAVIGKEGITGVITSVTLKLLPKPESIWGIAFFFSEKKWAGNFIEYYQQKIPEVPDAKNIAVEYIDQETIALIEQHKNTIAKIKGLPDVPENTAAMIYIELCGTEDGVEAFAEQLMEWAAECESDIDTAWAVSGENEVEKLRTFRHAAAETSNLCIEAARRECASITKLGTDMYWAGTFTDFLNHIEQTKMETDLDMVVFGHALENHMHINILPKIEIQYQQGILLIRNWANEINHTNGRCIGEHGIGKLKQEILGDCIPENYQKVCEMWKKQYDLQNVWNVGNIFVKKAVKS